MCYVSLLYVGGVLKLSETGKILFEQLELRKSFMEKCDFSMHKVSPENAILC